MNNKTQSQQKNAGPSHQPKMTKAKMSQTIVKSKYFESTVIEMKEEKPMKRKQPPTESKISQFFKKPKVSKFFQQESKKKKAEISKEHNIESVPYRDSDVSGSVMQISKMTGYSWVHVIEKIKKICQ